MRRRVIGLIVALGIFFALAIPAFAQTYAFRLDRETVHVIWEDDGTLSLAYELVFTNEPFASPIDYVDVGLPHSWNLSNAYAQVNGVEITHIRSSEYVDGAELGLGSNAIRPGETGTVQFQIEGIRNVLYHDSDDDTYASAVFSPNYFGSEFVSGSTDLTVVYHMPPGVQPDEPRWHQAPSGFGDQPSRGFDDQGRITYTWRNQNANGYTQYLFGASFPAVYVPASSIQTPSLFENLGIDPEALLGGAIFSIVCLFIAGIPVLSIISARRRRFKYLPPKIAIEGHGIKRGLTAIEAAILLEQPMDKILTMILFAVIKKGAAAVLKKDPLTLDITDPAPKDLRTYETDFLTAMKEDPKTKQRKALQQTMITLVKSVSRKMKGFSRRETRKYYKDIMERAWAQVEKADTPEVRGEVYDKVMEWTMLDRDYDDRTREVFRHHPVYIPHWWHRYRPSTTRLGGGTPTPRPSTSVNRPTPGGTSLPNLPGSDFAASVVNGVESFAGGVIGNVSTFTSGVTQKTNPAPKPSSSSGGYRSSGGSSCACACACAGCACACAGGGR